MHRRANHPSIRAVSFLVLAKGQLVITGSRQAPVAGHSRNLEALCHPHLIHRLQHVLQDLCTHEKSGMLACTLAVCAQLHVWVIRWLAWLESYRLRVPKRLQNSACLLWTIL